MPKTSGKFIWIITIAVLIAIALILGGTWGYPRYLLHKARADLFSNEPKLMGPAFAYLLGRGDAGLKTLEDFCRENTDTGWGEEVEGLRIRISTNGFLVKRKTGWPSAPGNLRIEIENVSQNEIHFGVCSGGIDMSVGQVNCFIINQKGKVEEEWPSLYRGHTVEISLKPSEKFSQSYIQVDGGFNIRNPGIYQMQLDFSGERSGETVKDAVTGKVISQKETGGTVKTIVSNRITFVVLPE